MPLLLQLKHGTGTVGGASAWECPRLQCLGKLSGAKEAGLFASKGHKVNGPFWSHLVLLEGLCKCEQRCQATSIVFSSWRISFERTRIIMSTDGDGSHTLRTRNVSNDVGEF